MNKTDHNVNEIRDIDRLGSRLNREYGVAVEPQAGPEKTGQWRWVQPAFSQVDTHRTRAAPLDSVMGQLDMPVTAYPLEGELCPSNGL